MLVIVHQWNIQLFFQSFFYIESLWCFDIFQIYPSKSRRYRFHDFYKFIRVFFINFYVKNIDIRKYLEQKPFTLHHRLRSLRTDITKPQNSRSITDYSHEISFRCVFIDLGGVFFYFKTRFCHSRRIRQTQIPLCSVGFRRHHLDFPFRFGSVMVQSSFFQVFFIVFHHFNSIIISRNRVRKFLLFFGIIIIF